MLKVYRVKRYFKALFIFFPVFGRGGIPINDGLIFFIFKIYPEIYISIFIFFFDDKIEYIYSLVKSFKLASDIGVIKIPDFVWNKGFR